MLAPALTFFHRSNNIAEMSEAGPVRSSICRFVAGEPSNPRQKFSDLLA